MNHIDPDDFVIAMTPQLTAIATLATLRQSSATALFKPEDSSASHEKDWENRIGVLSEVDLEIQERILSFVLENWPFVSLLAEEHTATKAKFPQRSEYCVLLDPIDGTNNYVNGTHRFCHILSLMKGTEMLASMLYLHATEQLFVAIAGHGVRVRRPTREPQSVCLRQAIGNVFMHHVSRIPDALSTQLQDLAYEVRISTQNASDIVAMFDGEIVGFISLNPLIYDVWSPAMVVQEGGGWLSDWHGNRLRFEGEARIPHVLVAASEREATRVLPYLRPYA